MSATSKKNRFGWIVVLGLLLTTFLSGLAFLLPQYRKQQAINHLSDVGLSTGGHSRLLVVERLPKLTIDFAGIYFVLLDNVIKVDLAGLLPRSEWLDEYLPDLRQTPELKELNLSHNPVTDAQMRYLMKLKELEVLSLAGTSIGNAGLSEIGGFEHLTELNLSQTKITDAGLASLKGLTHLESLSLNETQITDAGLGNLKGLHRLRTLEVNQTGVSDAGIRMLQETLPKLSILDD